MRASPYPTSFDQLLNEPADGALAEFQALAQFVLCDRAELGEVQQRVRFGDVQVQPARGASRLQQSEGPDEPADRHLHRHGEICILELWTG